MVTSTEVPPSDDKSDTPKSRLLAALDLMELGFALKRQNLKREMPRASEKEIDARLQSWILE
jgi:hypothetical protein